MPENLKATNKNNDEGEESLKVLFTSECLTLTEYLECVIPAIYGSFVVAMAHLPSAQYHTEMGGVTCESVSSVVLRMFAYALLDFVSFVLLTVILWNNCGVHALYKITHSIQIAVLDGSNADVPSRTLRQMIIHFAWISLTSLLYRLE
ncbi:hypothetical protein PHPALM_31985 [Phytophthora palmivora]|uniref:Uncharacterized protein n=1 Tax=Phytophthora palmivora TaxID=4796 RepID=A0A2P4X194_9STRA|nr:hypothetical protein PHPALM_31985 [Phytophthora palmivora]